MAIERQVFSKQEILDQLGVNPKEATAAESEATDAVIDAERSLAAIQEIIDRNKSS